MALVYVSGHRNADLDSIGAAIGYAELKSRLQPEDRFVPARLGPVNFEERPVRLAAINDVLGGRIVCGEDREISGRLWVVAVDVDSMDDRIGPGDIAVVGDRPDAQRRALEIGAAVLVTSHDTEPAEGIVALARERDAAVVVSPLDSYVSGRMIQLAVPCESVMSCDPLTVAPDDLLAEVTGRIKDVEYNAAIALGADGAPVGIVTRGDVVTPRPRGVILVDHAEQAQSVPGIEEADIVEILDHHHIGSIKTRLPVKATFDPVGSTATLVAERLRREGCEPERSTATMLLAALLSDTVVLTSPTTTDRDRDVVEQLEALLGLDARAFGMEMFEASSDASDLEASEIVARDAKEYTTAAGHTIAIAQFETVGGGLLERQGRAARGARGRAFATGLHAERADGHRHRERGDRAADGGRRDAGGARIRRARQGRRPRSARRDEPQEAGRAEAHGRGLSHARRPTESRRRP